MPKKNKQTKTSDELAFISGVLPNYSQPCFTDTPVNTDSFYGPLSVPISLLHSRF